MPNDFLKTMKTCLSSLVLIGMASTASAGPIVLGNGAWNSDAPAFWDNRSYDRNGIANVGVFLAGTPGSDVPGFYDNSPRLAGLEWLGFGDALFTWDADWDATDLLRVSDWRGVDRIERLAGGVLQFTTPAGTWRSDTLDEGRSHFALFRTEGVYYLGLEDATWGTTRAADWDYNDLVVRIPTTPVPERGGTLALLALTMLGLCACAGRGDTR